MVDISPHSHHKHFNLFQQATPVSVTGLMEWREWWRLMFLVNTRRLRKYQGMSPPKDRGDILIFHKGFDFKPPDWVNLSNLSAQGPVFVSFAALSSKQRYENWLDFNVTRKMIFMAWYIFGVIWVWVWNGTLHSREKIVLGGVGGSVAKWRSKMPVCRLCKVINSQRMRRWKLQVGGYSSFQKKQNSQTGQLLVAYSESCLCYLICTIYIYMHYLYIPL